MPNTFSGIDSPPLGPVAADAARAVCGEGACEAGGGGEGVAGPEGGGGVGPEAPEGRAVAGSGAGDETGPATPASTAPALGPTPGSQPDGAGPRRGCPSSLMRKVRC